MFISACDSAPAQGSLALRLCACAKAESAAQVSRSARSVFLMASALSPKLVLFLQLRGARLRHAREAEGLYHRPHRAALVLRRLEDAGGVAVLYPSQLRL